MIKRVGKKRVFPMVALRGLVVFPHMVLHFDIGREKSIAALEQAMAEDQNIFLPAQKDVRVDDPGPGDIYEVGTIAKIKQVLKLPGDTIRVLVDGTERAQIVRFLKNDNYLEVELEKVIENDCKDNAECEALKRSILMLFEQFVKKSSRVSPEALLSVSEVKDAGKLADIVASHVLFKMEDKQRVLECFDAGNRLRILLRILSKEIEILGIENEINQSVRDQIDKSQREYYLKEQVKAIQRELGEADTVTSETAELRQELKKLKLSEEVLKKAEKELSRMEKMSPGSPEINVVRTYLDWIVSLPWNESTMDNLDLVHVEKILNEDHYGLEKVKQRIVEYLAVRKMKNDMRGPILCFIGPPGVGKTSVARSIARAIGRKFVRMSLGGVRDEAEIRGHRRTYIGAIPGRIVSSIKQAGSNNPVFLFDELDKMSSDFRGDPAAAMLEVLDPEINNTFRDHYLDLPFDLSKVMFLTTANTPETIPKPLLDRLEIIYIESYTEIEKFNIAKRHLIKKQAEEHGLTEEMIAIQDKALMNIIGQYTRESGVRNLEREIATLCRKAAREIIEQNKQTVKVTTKNLKKYLGIPRYTSAIAEAEDRIGVATGLAWTSMGGQILQAEATVMEGTGKLELTGQLGDVMTESAKTGLSLVRTRYEQLGIARDFYEKKDIHIHLPEGAIPKDGPSAGITMVTAVVSALTKRPVRKDIAMTGEVTLTGRVLPIGGLKEKVLAALRAGITTVIIPKGNEKDLSELPASVKRKLTFVTVEKIDEVLEESLV